MILDTSFLIDLMKGELEAVKRLKYLEDNKIAQNVAAPTLYELNVGITLSDKPEKEKKRVIDALTSASILVLEAESAERAGEVQGKLIKEGKMLDPEDAMIAGIALVNDETILSRNKEHFSRVADLRIETY